MTKSTIRGNWPGLAKEDFSVVEEPYTGRASPPGASIYQEWIDRLSKAKPGQVAIKCKSKQLGHSFAHALSRHLTRTGKNKKFRVATMQDGDASKVWLIER
jgi:hypothetical protein